jgi:hypothetical protein
VSPSATFYFGAATASLAAILFAALIVYSKKTPCTRSLVA